MVDVTSNPALMLDFKSGIEGIPTIDLTTEEIVLPYPPLKANIAQDPEDDLDVPTTALGHYSHQHSVRDESFSSVAPMHTDSGGAPAMPSTSVLRNIPTASLVMDKQEFSPKSINRLKALMSKESRTQTLIKVGTEEATTHFDAHTSQDEASYDGDISEVDKEDVDVVPDKVDDAQIEGLKPAGADTLPHNEGQQATNKGDDGKTSKPTDKKPVQKHSNRASSGSLDGPVCYDKNILARGQRDKYPKDHISVHCVQRAGRVLIMHSFDMLKDNQKMSDIYFHIDVILVNGSTLQGGEFPSIPWYPDTTETGAATQDLSWLIKIHHASFPRVHAILVHIQAEYTLHTILIFEERVTYFHCGMCTSSTHYQQSGAHVLWPQV